MSHLFLANMILNPGNVKEVKIQRKDDDSISGKLADFTSETIDRIIKEGYQDALSKWLFFR